MTYATTTHLESLFTAATDAKNGYQEALKDAKGRGMTPLFEDLMALHGRHADQLAAELLRAGVEVSSEGSLMTFVHKTIMDIRSLFGGLEESVLPGLIDGEKRNVAKYDTALASPDLPSSELALLRRQRDSLNDQIAIMRRMHDLAVRDKAGK